MAYASVRFTDPSGPSLRLVPSLVGAVCAIVAPSVMAACVVTLLSDDMKIGDALRGSVLFAGFGLLSFLIPFLPLIAWRLPLSANPPSTCLLVGAISGPGPIGYWFLPYLPSLALLMFPMGAAGGAVFWLVAVRTQPTPQGSPDG